MKQNRPIASQSLLQARLQGIVQSRTGADSGKTRSPRRLCRLLLPPLLAAVVALLGSCAGGSDAAGHARYREIRAAIEAAQEDRTPGDAYDALLQLHRRYPDSPLPALALARVALNLGRGDRARTYLELAQALHNASQALQMPETELNAAMISSELAYREGRFTAAAEYARLALEAGGGVESRLVLARALARSGDSASAVNAFEGVLDAFKLEDYGTYATALQATGSTDDALSVLALRQRRYGYLPGQGAQESMLHNHAERPAAAAAAALMDVEYLRYHNGLPDHHVLRNIDAALATLDTHTAENPIEEPTERHLLQGYAAHVGARWRDARPLLEQASRSIHHPFVDYLVLVARLQTIAVTPGSGVPEELHAYAELEPLFASFQPYYYHLWQALKRFTAGYSILTARELLEKTILLAPGSTAAAETRGELGRLVGLDAAEADMLLLGDEIERLSQAVLAYRDPRLLDALLDALSLRETEYTVGAMIALQRLAAIGPLGDYLHDVFDAASGALRDRLHIILDATGRMNDR